MDIPYTNKVFMESSHARTLRILAEYIEPNTRLERLNITNTIVFFGSARIPSPEDCLEFPEKYTPAMKKMSKYYEAAQTIAHDLAKRLKAHEKLSHKRYTICTGGGPGIMEAGNRGAAEANATTIALGIKLPFEQGINPYVHDDYAFNFHYFFMRKYWFAYLAKAMIAFPGGFGTLDELFETLTLLQTKKMTKKCPIILYGKEFWTAFMNFDILVEYGLIDETEKNLFVILDDPNEVVDYIEKALEESYAP